VEEGDLGKVFPAPCDVVLSNTDVVQPDLLFVSREREHILVGGDNVQGAPDLVVEILSPSTAHRDRGLKLDLYQKSGVAEYWIVDTERRVVHQYVLEDGVFRASGEHAERITVACTAGRTGRPIRIDLTEIW
jgi:Uma2 family endonuclease